MSDKEVCARFGLHNGQFFAKYKLKNQWWFLNGKKFGYGDLRDIDIVLIQERLVEDEIFEGFNEHHESRYQRRENPMVIITKESMDFPARVEISDETFKRIQEEYG